MLGTLFMQALHFEVTNLPAAIARPFLFIGCLYTGRLLCIQWQKKGALLYFIGAGIVASFLVAVVWWLAAISIFGEPHVGFIELSLDTAFFIFSGIAIGIMLRLIRSGIRKQIQDAQMAAIQKESELELLQYKLSPHFLFNTLNNIYATSIEAKEQVPGLLLKLSDLLRYSLYDTRETFVPLRKELDYINNYIEFEKMRLIDRLQLNIDISLSYTGNSNIATMILIVFIENAFKHAKNTLNQKIFIDLNIYVEDSFIYLKVSNSYKKYNVEAGISTESSGIGLSNVIKRLELLYGNDYDLKQVGHDQWYTVELKLPVK
ncbi:MAG: histidine kinase [Chitinophagaceae bacterium]|nr:histidine kinase [Chitinophagaceae bacterium]